MKTSSGWKGDRKFVPLDGSRVIILKANKRKPTSFNQSVDSKDVKDMMIKLRYKAFKYKGRGLQIRGTRGDGAFLYQSFYVQADGKWHELKWKYSDVRGSRKINFLFTLLEGEGEVFFDDVTVEVSDLD